LSGSPVPPGSSDPSPGNDPAMDDPRRSLLVQQLALAFDRRSWHGPNLLGSLRGITFEGAAYRPQPRRHNVWEVVLHCAYWKYRVCRLLPGNGPRSFPARGSDWFVRPAERSRSAWTRDRRLLAEWHGTLVEAVRGLDPADLDRRAGNSEFSVAELVSGAAAHDLYHAGQIRLLRRMYADASAGEAAEPAPADSGL
jgi:hypothetical protein